MKTLVFLLFLSATSLASVVNGQSMASSGPPNIVVILVDDMGYSDLGCFGSEIQTPRLDALAANGLRFSQMYNTAKCYPTRASLLTGLYFQRTNRSFDHTATLGEVLRPAGYRTLWSGKHHANFNPKTRGFDRFYGLLGGAQNHFNPGSTAAPGQSRPARKGDSNSWDLDGETVRDFVPEDPAYFDSDAFTDYALQWLDEYADEDQPFLLYLSYTAPHWPLQAWPRDIAKYAGVYDVGYDVIRAARYQKQIEIGLVDPAISPLSEMNHGRRGKAWALLSPQEQRDEAKRMEIYAAMVDNVDQNVGRLVDQLEAQGELDNTLILFLSDNGACAEIPQVEYVDPTAPMGTVGSYDSYGESWATVGNTPLRRWKSSSYEGGVRTSLVAHWPAGIKAPGSWIHEPAHVIDLMPTVLEIGQGTYPGEAVASAIAPPDGVSLVPAFEGRSVERAAPLFFQFNKGAAVRDGDWKLVRLGPEWELYDMATDQTETRNLAAEQPERVQSMIGAWETWWRDCRGEDYVFGMRYSVDVTTPLAAERNR